MISKVINGTEQNVAGNGGGGTNDYEELINLPQINGNELIGNKTGADLGLVDLSEKSITLTPNGNIETSQYVFKKKGGVIVGNGYIINIPLVEGNAIQLGTLDTNYAPLDTIRIPCAVSDYAYNPPQTMGFLSINTDGTIYLNANLTGTYTCYFNVSYIK